MRLGRTILRLTAHARASYQAARMRWRSGSPLAGHDPARDLLPSADADDGRPSYPEILAYSDVERLPLDLATHLYESAQRLTAALNDSQSQVAHHEGSSLAQRLSDVPGLEPLRSALQELAVAGLGSAMAVQRTRALLGDAQDHLLRRLGG